MTATPYQAIEPTPKAFGVTDLVVVRVYPGMAKINGNGAICHCNAA